MSADAHVQEDTLIKKKKKNQTSGISFHGLAGFFGGGVLQRDRSFN